MRFAIDAPGTRMYGNVRSTEDDRVNAMQGERIRTPGVGQAALLAAHWVKQLTETLRERVIAETTIRQIRTGGFVCRKGDPVAHWIGVLDGLVKLGSVSPEGKRRSASSVCRAAGGLARVRCLRRSRGVMTALLFATARLLLAPETDIRVVARQQRSV